MIHGNRKFYSPKELAGELEVSERTVRRWVKAGHVRAGQVARCCEIRIPADEARRVIREFGQAEVN